MHKILSIVGARPQFIKLGPFSKALKGKAHEIIVHTGQHYDDNMSDFFLKDLEIPRPGHNLNIGSLPQGAQTGRMIEAIEKVLLHEKPDAAVVFGDTNSTMAGAIAAVKLSIKTIHIEAGLRSFNRTMPEEINRIVADHTADILFAPTKTAMNNLKNEGLGEKAFLTGDIMVDALDSCLKKAVELPENDKGYSLPKSFFLLTLHRPYNVDDPQNLALLLSKLENINNTIVFPVHPRSRKIIETNKIKIPYNVKLVPPHGYIDFIRLQWLSQKIITDSGGVQKEAYLLEKPCITLRPETEWVETVENGWNILLDHNDKDFESKLTGFSPENKPAALFGENVARKMVSILLDLL